MSVGTFEELEVDTLKLDTDNPRAYDSFPDQDAAMEELVVSADVSELVQSIALSGWLDMEPLIVLKDENVVLEGNRRLVALRLIRDPPLAKRLGVSIPTTLHENAQPERVRCLIVDSPVAARDYIGFKHINGPFKWDAFAKAKYAASWLDDEGDIDLVARRLGDGHNTVVRLINGFRVYQQAESLGFDKRNIPGRFSFSHLYTALTRPNYRNYLGLPEGTRLLNRDPVAQGHLAELTQVMEWLFGQDSRPSVIRSQNPDLKRLGEVIASTSARGVLTSSLDLDTAHALVEDKVGLFAESVYNLQTEVTKAAARMGGYQADEELLELMDGIVKTVRGIHASMKVVVEDAAEAARDNAGDGR